MQIRKTKFQAKATRLRDIPHDRQSTISSLLVNEGIFVGLSRPPRHYPLMIITRPVVAGLKREV